MFGGGILIEMGTRREDCMSYGGVMVVHARRFWVGAGLMIWRWWACDAINDSYGSEATKAVD